VEDAVAEWTEPLPWGTAVFHKGVPWVREVNVVRVETTHGIQAGEVERVYTAPSHRGRGLAYAVVARAAHEAGEHLTFLFTDAHGGTQHLYARLGFRRAWVVYRFLRAEAPGSELRQ
jgi:GNAT superfamily N-acetyltransferase